jgi:hypothetical protein
MSLPAQIKSQIEEANKAEEALLKNHQSEETPLVTETPDTPLEEENVQGSDSQEEPIQDADSDSDSGDEGWEHKYKVLQGKYNAEVPRLQKDLKNITKEKEQLLNRLSVLEQVVSNMNSNVQPNAPQKTSESEVEEEDEELKTLQEAYPEVYNSVVKLLDKKVKQEIAPKLDTISKDTFAAKLSSYVPNWEVLNTDPDFVSWLQEVDPLSGYTRHQLLLTAYQNQDVTKVANFFKVYENTVQKNQLEETPTVENTPIVSEASRNVAPTHREKATSGNISKKIFKQSEIEDFYKKASLGKIKGEAKTKQEAAIVQAVMEGRILYDK